MEVVVLGWPQEENRRAALALAGAPRLLVVPADAPAPVVADELEDWLRTPAPEADLDARLRTLRARALSRRRARPRMVDGLLTHRGAGITLGPVEALLAGVLVDHFGTVVGRVALTQAAWPDAAPARNRLDVHVLRLRRRIAPLGLVITTVRRRGYLLEEVPR